MATSRIGTKIPDLRPPGMKLMGDIRKKLDHAKGDLAKAQKRAASHRKMMTVARFTPEGYKKAVAEQKKLDAKVTTLEAEVKRLQHALFSIG